jgi:hypothetical protein
MFLPFPATLECSQRLMYATDSRKEAREILLAEYISNCHENETKEYEWGELSREYANRHMSSLSLSLSCLFLSSLLIQCATNNIVALQWAMKKAR